MKKERAMEISNELAAQMIPSHVKWVNEGRGTGSMENYVPFLKTENMRGDGKRTIGISAKCGRCYDVMSRIEDRLAVNLEWSLGVREFREQYPLNINETRKIAARFGWKHPGDTRTGLLSVMTTDFYIVMADNSTRIRTVKDARALNNPSTLRKLWIEREYFRGLGVTDWKIVTQYELSKVRAQNIVALLPSINLEDFQINGSTAIKVRKFCEAHLLDHASLAKCSRACDEELGLTKGESLAIARHLIVTRKWHWDLSVPFDLSEPGAHRHLVPTLDQAA